MFERKIDRDIRLHPERFDFADIPSMTLSPEQKAQYDASKPQWAKDLLAEVQAKNLSGQGTN
jgi:hypothetical protein